MLEAARDNGGFTTAPASTSAAPATSGNSAPSKGKSKGILTALNASDPESEDEAPTNAHIVTGNYLDQPRLKLQVPMPTSES